MKRMVLALALVAEACGAAAPSAPSTTTPGVGTGGGSSTPPPAATRPVGAYWSWRQTENWVTSPLGYSYLTYDFEYVFRSFGPNGLVYTGAPLPDLATKVCAPGEQDCEPFSVSGGMITIGANAPKPLVKTATGWKMGSDSFTAMPAYDGLTLSGTYKSTSCALASCSEALITFTPDGRYTTSTLNTYANTLGDTFVGASGAADTGGTYQLAGQHADIVSSSGKRSRVFFFRDRHTTSDGTVSDTIQLADTWFKKQ